MPFSCATKVDFKYGLRKAFLTLDATEVVVPPSALAEASDDGVGPAVVDDGRSDGISGRSVFMLAVGYVPSRPSLFLGPDQDFRVATDAVSWVFGTSGACP